MMPTRWNRTPTSAFLKVEPKGASHQLQPWGTPIGSFRGEPYGNLQKSHTNALIQPDEQSTPSSCKHRFSHPPKSPPSKVLFYLGCPRSFVDRRMGRCEWMAWICFTHETHTLYSQRLSDIGHFTPYVVGISLCSVLSRLITWIWSYLTSPRLCRCRLGWSTRVTYLFNGRWGKRKKKKHQSPGTCLYFGISLHVPGFPLVGWSRAQLVTCKGIPIVQSPTHAHVMCGWRAHGELPPLNHILLSWWKGREERREREERELLHVHISRFLVDVNNGCKEVIWTVC